MLLLRRRAGEDRCLVLILRCRLTKGVKRCVCFDPSKQKVLKGYEESREAVKFVNVSGNSGGRLAEEEIVVTKRSCVEPANNSDIAFEYGVGRGDDGNGKVTSKR